MKKIRLFLMFGLFIGGLVLTSCTKEGEVGPEGPAGKDGNANVNSKEFTITNWVKEGVDYKGEIKYAAITEDIVARGAILVYAKVSNDYYTLPFTIYPTDTYSETFSVISYVGGVTIGVSDSDQLTLKPGSLTIKVVVIAANTAKKAKTSIDFSNYKEVKDYFNL